MQKPIVKTYSRITPVIAYKPSSGLVSVVPEPEAQSNVRQSRLNQTLEVDIFDNTFDRIYTEVNSRPPRECVYTSETIDESDGSDSEDNSHDFYKGSMSVAKKEKKVLSYKFLEQENKKLCENSKNSKEDTSVQDNKGIKRKNYSKENDQVAEVPKFKKPKRQTNTINALPDVDKTQELEVSNENEVANNISSVNDSFQVSKNVCNAIQRKFTRNFPTSTPRERKQKMIIAMENLSPIRLNKENISKESIGPNLGEKQIIKESKETSQCLSEIDGTNAIIERSENVEETNSQLQGDNIIKVQQLADKTQCIKVTPIKNNKNSNTSSSFVKSPLLFDDTSIQQKLMDKEHSIVLTPTKLNKNNDSKLDISGKLDNTQNENSSESSFSPHDWSNERDSIFNYSSKKYKSLINKTSNAEKSGLEKSYEDKPNEKNSVFISEELSDVSKLNASENSQLQSHKNDNCEFLQIENTTKLIDSFDLKNSISDPKKCDNNPNNFSNKSNEIGSDTKSFELQVESNNSNTKEKSFSSKDIKSLKISEITECNANLLDDKIIDVNKCQVNSSSSKDQRFSNSIVIPEYITNQTDTELITNICNDSNKISSADEEINSNKTTQSDEVNKKLNGQILRICLTRIDPDVYKSTLKESQKKQSKILDEDSKKSRGTRKSVKENRSTKNKLENLSNRETVIQSGRVMKNKWKKDVLNKSTKTSRKKKDTYKKYAMDIIEHGRLRRGIDSEENDTKYKELCQSFEIKESYVRIPLLKESSISNNLSTSKKKSKGRTIKRKSKNKNDKSITKILTTKSLDKNDIEQKAITVDEQNQFVNTDETNPRVGDKKLSDILSKLKDPVNVTQRRHTYKRLDRSLTAITTACIAEEDSNEENQIEARIISNAITDSSADESEPNKSITYQNHPIFLKPGKSWARSLSIINHFHTGQNLDQFAVGRGKNWRYSVQNVLNMQPEANSQGIVKSSNDKDEHLHYFNVPVVPPRESNRVSTILTSPTRFSRFSIRIIPDGKRSTLTNDFSPLRASTVSSRTRKTLSTRKTSTRISKDILIRTEEDLIRSARNIILTRCKQISYLNFSESFPDSYIKHCQKIGEGVYGEVFLYQNRSEKSVIKIIPIEGDELVNCEPQKKFHEILSEIIISEELHKLEFGSDYNTNGFVGIKRIMCVIGKYPKKLIDLWNAYDEEKNSENDCPSMFNDDQLYIILELAHGGQDLEAYVFQNASESYSIFLQTAFTLAIAEQALEFEHRDLHWGNILISKCKENKTTYVLGNEEISLNTKGVKVSIIDFTLSRMSYEGCKIFNDLAADPTLFTAQGEYQFDIYRMMRDNINDDWQQFNPYTNILWLDYTLDKMITAARYKRKTSKIHKNAIEEMQSLRQEILNYKSAFEFVSKCKIITMSAKA